MGANVSSLLGGASAEAPVTVLVPPMFERDVKARSRMAKSSYDYLFAKPALRWLFTDYFTAGMNTSLLFAPAADPRVSVRAKLEAAGSAGAGGARGGSSMTIRYQPFGTIEPQCFVDVKASPQTSGGVTLRACAFSTDTGIGSFALLPLAGAASGRHAQLGVRYSSQVLTAGAVLQPSSNTLSQVWLCGRHDGLTVGLQLRPDLRLDGLSRGLSPAAAAAAGGDTASWLRGVTSAAVSYSPAARTRAGQHSFTAAVELVEGHTFVASFFQHMASVRQVFNPLERDDVIGITNYIDIGLQLHVPLDAAPPASSPGSGAQAIAPLGSHASAGASSSCSNIFNDSSSSSSSSSQVPGLRLAAAWQINKNVYVKGRLGADGVALMAALKTWSAPSFALAAVLERRFDSNTTRSGITVQVENFGRLRYERSREAAEHGAVLTQRHEATAAEVAAAQGDRPLVGRRALDSDFNVPEPRSTSYL